jgi:hypothetical protein
MKPLNILILCDEAARHTDTVDQHIKAFQKHSVHRVLVLDSRAAGSLDLDLSLFDAVVFHYSIVISMPSFLPHGLFDRLAQFDGLKLLFIQDEYRWVDRTSAAIRNLGISVIFTVVNNEVIREIYREKWFDSVRFEQTLTGFVPEHLLTRNVPEFSQRRIDVSYRARKVPSWLGEFGQEKWIIGERFKADGARYGLKTDIEMSEQSRIYGDAWIDFVANSKAVLGTESGASFIDYSGEAQQNVDAFEAAHPSASFSDVQKRFLDGDGRHVIHVISPRCFEAAALRTLMILYPGTYSGHLQAGRHFVELARDHANIDEVVAVLRDETRAGRIIEAAYHEVAKSPKLTFKYLVERFDSVTNEEMLKRPNAARNVSNRATSPRQIVVEKFAALEQASAELAQKRKRAMSRALALQRVSSRIQAHVARSLPKPVAKRLLGLGNAVKARAKPIVRRFLLGRMD